MKRFQRANAFILAVALIISMFPAGILKLKTSAETSQTDVGKTFLHASYIAAGVTVDGAQDDGYRFDVPVGDLRLGAAWDKDNLYLAFNSADPKIETLKINDETVDLTSAVSAVDTCMEYKLSLPADLNGTNKLTVKIGSAEEVTLYLVFMAKGAPTAFSNYSVAYGVLSPTTNAVKLDTLNGNLTAAGATEASNKIRKHQSYACFSEGDYAASFDASTVLDVDVTLHYLPDVGVETPSIGTRQPSRDLVYGGVNIIFMDDEANKTFNSSNGYVAEAVPVAFYRNGSELRLYYYDGGVYKSAYVDSYDSSKTYADDINKQYHLQVVFDYVNESNLAQMPTSTETADNTANNKITAAYYVNGKLVATSADAKILNGSFGSDTGKKVQAIAVNKNNSQSTEACLVPEYGTIASVANLSVTKTQPAIEVVRDIASLGDMVSLDKAAVEAARAAYNALGTDEAVLAQVVNLPVLNAAETYLGQTTYLHAEFVAAGLTTDGELDAAYRMNVPLPGGVKLGAAWDGKKLYLAFNDPAATVTELKVNGAELSDQKKGSNALEYEIALGDLNIPNYKNAYTVSFKLNDKEWTGSLTFDTVTFAAQKRSNDAYGTAYSNSNTVATITTSTSTYTSGGVFKGNKQGVIFGDMSTSNDTYEIPALSASTEASTVVEFDLTVNQIFEGTLTPATRDFCYGGIGFTVIDDVQSKDENDKARTEAFLYGFCKVDGVLSLVYWDTDGFKSAPVDLDGVGDLHVRAEFSYADDDGEEGLGVTDTVSAVYYVNGKKVAEGDNVRAACGSLVVKYPNIIQVIAQGVDAPTSTETADATKETNVVLKNVSVSKTNPAFLESMVKVADVEEKIAAIGEVSLEKKTKIEAAREAYKGLNEQAQPLVSNLAVLEEAEAILAEQKRNTLHAAFTATAPTVDGTLESVYRLNVPVSDTLKLGAAWDPENLYLVFNNADSEITELTVNGEHVSATPVTGTDAWEIQIPLLAQNIADYDGTYTVTFKADGEIWSGYLVLDTADRTFMTPGSPYWSATKNGNTVTLDSFAGSDNTYRSCLLYSKNEVLTPVTGTATVLELDFVPTYMPDTATATTSVGRAFLYGGLTFTVVDDQENRVFGTDVASEAFLFGFGKVDGEMKLFHWYYDAADTETPNKYAVADVPQNADKYYVRVEYTYGENNVVSAKYYVNGALVADVASVRLKAENAFATKDSNNIQVYAGVQNTKQSETNKVQATVSDLSVGHTHPQLFTDIDEIPGVEALIDTIGTVTLESEVVITAARTQYDALDALAKPLVNADKLETLKAAEERLYILKNSYFHAAFVPVGMEEDGVLSEAVYRRALYLSETLKVSAAWDAENLYLAFADTAAPTVSMLKINGKDVTDAAVGTTGTGSREIKIPLADLEIDSYIKNYEISFQVDTAVWSGHLVLDTADYEALKHGALFFAAASADGKLSVVLDTITPDGDGLNDDKSLVMYSTDHLAVVSGAATVLEFGFDPTYMPDECAVTGTPSRNFVVGGISLTVRDDKDAVASGYGTKAFQFGFGKQGGEMKLIHWYYDAENNAYKSAVVDIEQSSRYYVRVEYTYAADGTVSAKYYVNGILEAESANVRVVREGGFGTGSINSIQIYAYAKDKTEANRLEATIRNLSVGHTHPNLVSDMVDKVPAVEALIDAIDTNVSLDSEAAITEARAAYEALDVLAKPLVNADKLAALEAADAKLRVMKNTYLHAAFTATELTVDGALEYIYKLNIPVSDTLKLGAAWDQNNLYLAFNSTDPKITDLVINSVAVTIPAVAGTDAWELKIPLADLNITDLRGSYIVTCKIDGQNWACNLVLDTIIYKTTNITGANKGETVSDDKKSVVINDLTAMPTITLASSAGLWEHSVTDATVLEFDLDITGLPEDVTDEKITSRYVGKGLNFLVLDDLCTTDANTGYVDQAFKFGFVKRGGVLYLGHAADGEHQFVAVDDDGTGKLHVRVAYSYADDADNTVSAEYYVNGVLVAKGDNVRVLIESLTDHDSDANTPKVNNGTATKSGGKVQLRVHDDDAVNVTLADVSVSNTHNQLFDDFAKIPDVEAQIGSLGTVTLESEAAIQAARDAYEALDELAKDLVSNLDVLQAAEERLYILQNSYLHALFSAVGMQEDGVLSETVYRRALYLSDTLKLSLAWDVDNLYLAFADTAVPTVSGLKINGKTVTATGKTGEGVREIKIPLADLEIGSYTQSYEISFQVGEIVWSGYLVLDTVDYEALKHSLLYYAAAGSQDKLSVVLDTLTPDADGNNTHQTIALYKADKLAAAVGAPTVVEFGFVPTYMPDNAKITPSVSRAFLQGGIGVAIVDDQEDRVVGTEVAKEGFLFGFGKQDGEMKLVYWYYDAEAQASKTAVVDLEQSNRYYVRVEYSYAADGAVSARYYVNGVLVAESDAARVTGGFSTKETNNIQFYAGVANGKQSDTNKVLATISNVSASHVHPNLVSDMENAVPEVEALIDAIGTNVSLDSEAAITEARAAYEALDILAKPLVKAEKLAALEAAEAKLSAMKDTYLHAAFTATELTVDGVLDLVYKLNIPVSDTLKLGAAWDQNNLYLAFNSADPKITELKVNGVAVTATPVAGADAWEIKIPLSALNITDYRGSYIVTFKADGQNWAGNLVFDTIRYTTKAPGKTVAYGAVPSADGWSVVLNSFASVTDKEAYQESNQKHRDIYYPAMANLASSLTQNTVVELDLTLTYLPEVKTIPGATTAGSRSVLTGGVNITVLDDEELSKSAKTTFTEAMWSGLYQKNGKLYFIYWDGSQDAKYVSVLVGNYVEGEQYHLRLEYDYAENSAASTETNNAANDKVSAKYYINGKLIASSADAKRLEGEYVSTGPNTVLILAQGLGSDDTAAEETRVDVTVSNLYASKTHPQLIDDFAKIPDVENKINAIGTVTLDSDAAIQAARAAYEALDELAKDLVSNLNVLEAAESRLYILQNSYLHAVFTAVAPTVDGQLTELFFRRGIPLTATAKFGAAWDLENLYLFFADTQTPTVSNLKINNVPVTATGTTGNGVREIKISLADLGITSYTGTYAVSFQIGEAVWAGNLVLDTVDYEALKCGTLYFGATGSEDKLSATLNTITPDEDGGNTNRSIVLYSTDKLASASGAATVLEFGFDPVQMPDNCTVAGTPSRSFVYGGISLTVRDEKDVVTSGYGTKAFQFGFGKRDGEMKLIHWYLDAEDNTYKSAIVDLPESEQYYVRVEYIYGQGDAVSAKYFVNGVMVAESALALIVKEGGFGTASTNNIQIYALTKDATEANRVETTISNLSVGHTHPTMVDDIINGVPVVEDLIDAIGNVTVDSEAAIQAAVDAYEALDDIAKQMVSNLDVLEAAKSKLNVLKNSYLHAVFTATAPTIDGQLTELFFRRGIPLSATVKFGAAWDLENLYLFFADTEAPTVSDLKINGKAVTATGKTGNGVREIQIALADLGITSYTGTYAVSFRIGDIIWAGNLVLDTVDYEALKYGTLYFGAAGSDDKLSFTLNTIEPDKDGKYTDRSIALYSTDKLTSGSGAATVLEFSFTPTYMPDDSKLSKAPSRSFVVGGISLTVRDEKDVVTSGYGTKAFQLGFGKQDGEMKLFYWYYDEAAKAYKTAAVDLVESDQYYLRVEYTYGEGETVSAKYFVNGVLVAESDNALITSTGFGTASVNNIQIYAGANGNEEAGRVEAAFSNLSVGHIQPTLVDDIVNGVPAVEALIDAIGNVSMESEAAIKAAADAYEALSETAKQMVSNLDKLENAKLKLNMLKNSYLHAVFTATVPTIDGQLTELFFRRGIPLTATAKFGAAWDMENLYLYFADTAAPAVTDLKINGKAVTVNGKTGTTAREIQIALAELGITDVTGTYTISFRLNGLLWSGNLVLDAVDYEVLKHGTLYFGATSLDNKQSFILNTIEPDKDGKYTDRSIALYTTDKLASAAGAATVLEFGFDPTYMPDDSTVTKNPSRSFLIGGIALTVRDEKDVVTSGYGTKAFQLGFGKQNGDMKLIHWYYDEAAKAYKSAAVDLPESEQYYVRVEYTYGEGEAVSAKYFVNGILVAESDNALITSTGYGTANVNCIQVYAAANGKEETGRVEAAISNLAVSHATKDLYKEIEKAEAVEKQIAAIGTVTENSKAAVEAARKAYEELSSLVKGMVSNLKVLEDAETRLMLLDKSYLHAAFSYDSLTVDGKAYEAALRLNLVLSDTLRVGAAWDKNYLYLAFQDETAPTVSELVINGKTVKITSSNSKAGALAREIRISLSSLGIKGYDKTYPISFKVGDIYWSGTLVQDSNNYEALKYGTLYYGATASTDKLSVVLNTQANTSTKTTCISLFSTSKLASTASQMTIFEMDFTATNLPDNCTIAKAPGRTFVTGGLSVVVRDDQDPVTDTYGTKAFLFGFGRVNGRLKLIYWYYDAETETYKSATADVVEADSNHVRVEYIYDANKAVSAKYFVNGVLVAESDAAMITSTGYGTRSVNNIQFNAKSADESAENRVEVKISNVSVSQPQILIIDDASAALQVDKLIEAIGEVTLDNLLPVLSARTAYDALTSAQKKLVTNLAVLEAAEQKVQELKEERNKRYTSYIFADYTTLEMEMDGELKESIWRSTVPLYGSTKLGAAWDFDYLYLSFRGSDATKTLSNLKINGKAVSETGTTGTKIREVKILLSSVGIRDIDFNGEYTISFTLNGKNWEGRLVFDTATFKAIKPTSVFWGATKVSYTGTIKSEESTHDQKRAGMLYNNAAMASISGSSTVLEFDVNISAMPDVGEIGVVGRQFLEGGLSFTFRDDDTNLGYNGYGCEAFMFGLYKQNGQMMFVHWDNATDQFLTVPVEDYSTGYYHVRVDYLYENNDKASAKYFVNGMLVAESSDAKEIEENGAFSTSNYNVLQILGYGTNDGAVNAVISNLSVAHPTELTPPGPLDAFTKDYVFGRLDLNHVQTDLKLPTEYVNVNGERFELIWTSSDTSVVDITGKVTRPLENTGSATLSVYQPGAEDPLWSVTVKVDPMSLEEQESPENVDAAFSEAPIVIDGILDEEGWRMSGRVLDKNRQLYAEYSFQWTQTHLYVAVDYMREVTTLSFKINGMYYTMKDGKLLRGGEDVGGSTKMVAKDGIVEMCIPLSVLGLGEKISSYGVSVPMSIKAGPYVGNGKILHLSGIDWFVTESRDHQAPGVGIKNNDSYHGVQKLANGYRLYDLYGGSNMAQIRSYVSFMSTEEYIENFADRIYDTRIEFDFQADALPILPLDGSAYTASGGAYGNSGFTCAAGEIVGADNGALSFNYGIINTARGLVFTLNIGGNVDTYTLNKEVGDKFSVAVEWSKENTLKLFIDGVLVKTFTCYGYWSTSASNASLVVNMRSLFAPDGVDDNYDVAITNIAFGKVHSESGILAQLDFDDIRGKNTTQEKITADLNLPTSITNGQLDKVYPITWTSTDPALDPTTGKVTRPATGGVMLTLTATLPTGESKDFELVIYGTKIENDSVLHVVGDVDPANGGGTTYSDMMFTFDATNNSIIKILDGMQKVNFVVLTDGDDKARLTPETTTLWVSDDNVTYTRVKDYKMLQVGNKWYLYDFEAEGMYVKVHYTKPDEGESYFYGTYGQMIDAGYEEVFGGGGADFTQSQYELTNTTGKDKLDYAWTVSKKDLGITGTDASIRIYAEGKLLYHYVSGDNVVVRINDLAAGASVKLTVLSSNDDVMDIANKEGVHEVIYGVQNTTLSTQRWYYLTLPAGTTFPDGSSLEKETIFAMGPGSFRTSDDGGKTWTNGQVLNNAPEGKEPVTLLREGGWIYDSHTGRLMFEAYRRGSDDPNEGAFNKNNIEDSHMHTIIIASDDGGKTWYLQDTMPCRTCMEEYMGNMNIPTYALSYSDGTELSSYDGAGPNVDFVFPLGVQYDNIGTFACRIAYSRDGGYTWHYSETPITYPSLYGSEGGCSEGWIIERADGVLVLHVRAQDNSSQHFKVSYSYDKGLTWTNENIFTDYYAVNGQAFIREMEVAGETTVIAAWGGNTSLGSATYHRNPFVFASSANDGETFRNIQNIYFRSFEEKYENVYITDTTNVSLVSHSGDDLLFTYRRNRMGDWVITNVEDFDDWFTRTKGAYDNFEKGTMKGEGWNKVVGVVDLTSEVARDKYSLKLGTASMAIRSIPYLQDGTLSIDVYVTSGSSFTLELQSGHTRYYDQISVPIAMRIEGGKLYFNSSTTAAASGVKEGWNTLTFDLGLSKDEATLSINGGTAIDVPLKMDFDDYVNFINIGTSEGSVIYLDEFLVISETEVDLSTDDADQEAADEVVKLIKAIKNAGDTAAVKAARAAFDALTQAQQDLVDMRVLANNGKTGLDSMINYYEVLRMYEDGDLIVKNLIDAIGKVDENSGSAIEAAEEAYSQLTSAQKKNVSNYATLCLARLQFNRIYSHKLAADKIAAEAVQDLIDAIIIANPMRYESKITAARTAYNTLTADQMNLVDNRLLIEAEKKLEEQKEEYTRRSMASLQNLIDSLDNITINSKALVEGIRAKYNSLTAEQKQTINEKKLVEAEAVLRKLQSNIDSDTRSQILLDGVIDLIESIGTVTMEKKALIDATRYAYNKLTNEQKKLVWNIDTLNIAEATVESMLMTMDIVPATSDSTPTAMLMVPTLLLSVLALAALVIFRKKRFF